MSNSVPSVGTEFRTQSNDYLGKVLEVIPNPKGGSFRIRYKHGYYPGADLWTTWTVLCPSSACY